MFIHADEVIENLEASGQIIEEVTGWAQHAASLVLPERPQLEAPAPQEGDEGEGPQDVVEGELIDED
jgi:hypothetical protein